MICQRHSTKTRTQGVTLVELMVALAVGMILILAVFLALTQAEDRKRIMTGTNDASQSGAYAISILDRVIRSAGSGLRQVNASYGCRLFASRSGTQLLPITTAFALPAPFSTVNPGTSGVFRLAPVLILPGQTTPGASGKPSDVIVVMSGVSGRGDMPIAFSDFSSNTLTVSDAVGVEANDLLLVTNPGNNDTGATPICTVTQTKSTFVGGATTSIDMTGAIYYGGSTSLTSFGMGRIVNLGNPANNNPPQMSLYGVGDNNTLYIYDLLNTSGATTPIATPMADGIFELHALYGIDANSDGVVSANEWFSPTDATYNLTTLMAGTPAAASLLQQIKAIRIGLILRSVLPDSTAQKVSTSITPGPIVLFDGIKNPSGTDLSYSRELTGTETQYRYRTLETTIPVRNNLL